jgi:hypothetical protein
MVECRGRSGPQTVLCNLLGKETFPGLGRFAKAFDGQGNLLKVLYDERDGREKPPKITDLTDVFKTVVQAICSGAAAEHIGREATLLSHEVMLRAHQQLRAKISTEIQESGDPQQWWEQSYRRSLQHFSRGIRFCWESGCEEPAAQGRALAGQHGSLNLP